MIGRNYPSYRQRRPFRKYCYVIFVVVVICTWQSTILSRGGRVDPKHGRKPLSARKSAKHDEDFSSKAAYDPPPLRRPAPIENLGPFYSTPTPSPTPNALAPNTPARVANPLEVGRSVSTPKLTVEDDSELDSLDEIERIGAHRDDDSVEHSSKLTHPDDDDDESDNDDDESDNDDEGSMASFGHSKFEHNEQVPIGGKKNQKAVDELLKADHPSKEQFGEGKEEESAESPAEAESPAGSPRASLQLPIPTLEEHTPWSENYEFPAWEECQSIKNMADELPDLVQVPFEVSVRDVILQGWEDAWISKAKYLGPKLEEPLIDFVYNWVNGSQSELTETMHPYEVNSTLNDPEGVWIASHGSNRYREWDELRYSIRSVEKYAGHFTNRIQILVNAFKNTKTDENQPATVGKQRPSWLRQDKEKLEVLSQEEFFGPEERKCLPSFDSLTIENQLYNTKSETDRLFALSDDMILGKPHAASDLYSPLFGPTLGFKDNAYNTLQPPVEKDAERFGEKPFLIYTSWLLNRRFGARKRKGQVHFGHSLSRSITKEAITSFPRPAMRSAYQRFRGETGFQLYSWFVIFHYTMERHREALLWSYIMLRSDIDDDGYLNWNERNKMLSDIAEGMGNDSPETFRRRIYYRVGDHLVQAGLKPPAVNTDILWTSLDGPVMIKDLDCDSFDVEDCLAPGFSISSGDSEARSPVFSSAAIFDRVSRQTPRCGDCLIKVILNRRRSGLGPLLPDPVKKPEQRALVVKALMKYQYTIVSPDAMFYMVTDAEQAEQILLKPYIKRSKKAGQICLNDDVTTADEKELEQLRKVMTALLNGLLPGASSYEI